MKDDSDVEYSNRLIKIVDGQACDVADFAYDALGRRIKNAVYGDETYLYYYDGGWRVLAEYLADDVTMMRKRYVYGNYLDEVLLVARYYDYYYAHDHLYSPVALLSYLGTVVERYEYDAYGRRNVFENDFDARSGSSYGLPIAFTGQRLDELDYLGCLKLMYYKNRYYDVEMGRFLTRDPIGVTAGLNSYQYCYSSPAIYIDSEGKIPVIIPIVIGICLGIQGCNDRTPPPPDNPVIPDNEWGHHPDPTPLPGFDDPIPPTPSRGNCYRYACNDPMKPGEEHSVNPGKGTNQGGPITCDLIEKASLQHGLSKPNNNKCPEGTTKVAFAVTSQKGREGRNNPWLYDYHWYREVEPGKWCHKPGSTDVTCVDASGNPISDPQGCNRDNRDSNNVGFNYDDFCGFLCAPNNMDVDQPARDKDGKPRIVPPFISHFPKITIK